MGSVMKSLSEVIEKARKNTLVDPTTGCWIYLKGCNAKGYAVVGFKGKLIQLSRLSLHYYKDMPLISSVFACHHCERKDCWNPEHLYAGDGNSNMQDYSRNLRYCLRGHEYTPENTYLYKGKYKVCRKCVRVNKKIYRAEGRLK